MKLKALIFDVDGTLADTEEAHRLAFNQAFARSGLDWQWDADLYVKLLRTTGGKERMAAYLETLHLSATQSLDLHARIAALHTLKTAIYAELIAAGQVPLRDGVLRLLDEARAADIPVAIATTTTFGNIQALIEANLGPGGLARFAAIGAGDDVPRKKPAPDIYEFVLQRLGLAASDCVALEDSRNGLTAAKSAGLFTVVTPCRWTAAEDFADADLLLPSLGSPERPLTGAAAELVGGSMLGIVNLDRRLGAERM